MSDVATLIAHARSLSRFLDRLLSSRPEIADELAAQLACPCSRADMQTALSSIAGEEGLKTALRQLRARVMARLVARDLGGLADLDEVVSTLTALAEVTIAAAQQHHTRWLADIHGTPLGADGTAQELIVVAMGKLGGGELNASSDIDLIFVYPEEGETAPQPPPRVDPGLAQRPPPLPGTDGRGEVLPQRGAIRAISNHEFFVKLGKKIINALADMTRDGFVFRVDMRLRPFGDSGPLVTGFGALEQYLVTQGREWERYAWIKGRALTGTRHDELAAMVRPFVFRKYLDYGAFESMRGLHAQIRREVARRDLADNIKLGPGGIREIEFVAQVFQLIRGGQEPALQTRSTREALARIGVRELLPHNAVRELSAAYTFLRNLEHRLQYLDDAQTQTLPESSADRVRIAAAMGFPDWFTFLAALDAHRSRVSGHFEQAFAAPQTESASHPLAGLWTGAMDQASAHAALAAAGFRAPAEACARLQGFRDSSRVMALPDSHRNRLAALMPHLVEIAGKQSDPETTLVRILTLVETIASRGAYLSLLVEHPQALTPLIRMLAASPWAAQYLTRQPLLLDELLDPRALNARLDAAELKQELADTLFHIQGDVEREMDALRHFKHRATFHVLAQDLAGLLTVENIGDDLALVAELVLAATLDLTWRSLKNRHREAPAFALVGYGKLGGKEMGYASDLDLVFLYHDEAPQAPEVYARLAQRMNAWMGAHTAAGLLYETDLRLRPDGASGLLVSSLAAFEEYQKTKAWPWEHQAITRARYVAGDRGVGDAFERIRREIILAPRNVDALRANVLEMRRKMHDGHPNPGPLFDLKHDPGGIVDVEFMVQFLVLAHARAHPALADNVGNLALLARAADAGLVPHDLVAPVIAAYRDLRRTQHAARLAGVAQARVDRITLAIHADAVKALWTRVFGAPVGNAT